MMLFVFWLLCGMFASVVAGNKGHNGCMWALGGFLLGPLALVATLGLGDKNAQRRQDELLEETIKQNEWMRRKAWEAEQERRYYQEKRYQHEMRQLSPEENYEDEDLDGRYVDNDYGDQYEDECVDVEVEKNIGAPIAEDEDKFPDLTNEERTNASPYLPPPPPPPPQTQPPPYS